MVVDFLLEVLVVGVGVVQDFSLAHAGEKVLLRVVRHVMLSHREGVRMTRHCRRTRLVGLINADHRVVFALLNHALRHHTDLGNCLARTHLALLVMSVDGREVRLHLVCGFFLGTLAGLLSFNLVRRLCNRLESANQFDEVKSAIHVFVVSQNPRRRIVTSQL